MNYPISMCELQINQSKTIKCSGIEESDGSDCAIIASDT